jgi:hypothetical protein
MTFFYRIVPRCLQNRIDTAAQADGGFRLLTRDQFKHSHDRAAIHFRHRQIAKDRAGIFYPCRKRRSASRVSCSACLVTRAFVTR